MKLVLEAIEKKHNVNINYIEEEIAIFKIVPPEEKLSLDQKLNYISKKTKLEFKFVTDTYISIINNKNLDKPLCGYLLDASTQLPIESATVSIRKLNYSVISNEKGYFEFDLKTANDIEISHLNYEKKSIASIDLYKENCPNLYLQPKEYQLDEVITTVYLAKGISKKVDGSFEIKPKKFGLLPGLTEPDVFQTMLQLPGVMSVDETISNINVRGGTHDQNLFLWNGIRLFQTGHFYGLISVLNPNLAQKVTINKNGSSAFLGEGVSSTVNITTNSDVTKNNSSIGVNMINVDFNTFIKTSKKSSLELSGRRSLTDLWTSPTYKSYLNRVFQNTVVTTLSDNANIKYETDENFYFYDATLKFHQKIKEKTNLIFNLITIANHLDLDQSKFENNLTIRRQSVLDQETLAGSIDFNTIWNDKNSSQIIAYGSFYKVDSENQAIEGNQIFNQENTILDTNISLRNNHILNKKFTFKNGYQFNEIGIRNFDKVNSPLFSKSIKDILHIHALIAEMNYVSTTTKLNATLGFRQNYISQLQAFISEPRLQLNFEFSNHFQLEVLGEIKSQNSSQIVDLQQDFLGIEKRRWTLANNNDVPIIKSNQASVGLTFKKKNWLITLDNFYKKVTGISSRSQSFQNQLEALKINGEYRVLGSELLIQKQISNLIAWVTYTYTDNDYTFADFTPSTFPNNFENQHQVNTGIIYDYKHLKVAFGARWFTGKPTTLPLNNTIVDNQIVYAEPNSSRLDDYFQLNFSAGYTIELGKNSKLQMGASVQNLLDAKNTINQYFRINQNTSTIEKVNTYALERTPNAYLRFSF
ncbi:TonB-dependent receptor [Flavobacterium sp.]|uniref:TonB-dependent receptor n=1 Tax=Flavobacterium sp. TaxID=239 RepID=UPI002B4B06A6|nr:carboxypeptidase-like regulatory domain-containing protein [Flavobacterium sp.]HLP64342.1 carboxypeptidase-like regulatory domain-containing protein [Flavobacterium sp.]